MLFTSKGRKRYEKLNPIIDDLGARFPQYSKIKHFEVLSDGKPQHVFVCSCEKRILNQTMGRPICPKEHAIERKNNISNSILKPDCDSCIHKLLCKKFDELGLLSLEKMTHCDFHESPNCREYGNCLAFKHPEWFMNIGCIENCVVHVIYDTETKEVLWAFYDESECIKRFDYIQNCCTTSRKLDWKSVNLKYLFK